MIPRCLKIKHITSYLTHMTWTPIVPEREIEMIKTKLATTLQEINEAEIKTFSPNQEAASAESLMFGSSSLVSNGLARAGNE